MTECIIGIDLGTTNSEVAIVRDGRVEVIPIGPDRLILPSVVGFADDDTLLVGEPARNQLALHPDRTIRSIKRRMGEAVKITIAGQQYTPQEISAMILRRLKAVAESHLGQAVEKAVITVPAFFSDAQRQATREAGMIAGLQVMRIINEPTAAALAYESGHAGSRKVLVYDLGGGTFDVSVVNLEQDVVEVLASHGDNHLGGDDFDACIVGHLMQHLREQHGRVGDLPAAAFARVRRAAEAAKIVLTDAPFAQISEEYLYEQDGAPVHLQLELARGDYEAMIEHYVAATVEAAHIALDGAGLTVSDIDEILLVGGATRTPVIARRLEQEFGLQPRADVDPDLCVAMGAAIQAGILAGVETSTVLVDVTPYTFGTSAISELDGHSYPHCFVPMIRKNTPIPVSKSEVFYTAYDGQQVVNVTVYQGEDPDALNNIEIGGFRIEGMLADAPAGNPLVTTFSLDINGILHVTAREKETGLEFSVTIDNAMSRFDGGDLESATVRIGSLFDIVPETAHATPRHQVEAKALVEKAERLMDQVGADDREDLVNGVEAVNDALANEDEAALREAAGALADLIYYLES